MSGYDKRALSVGMAMLLSAMLGTPLPAAADTTPATASTPITASQQSIFPHAESLSDNVAFWRKVFSEWSQSQVALHDMDYPGLIYEVLQLDGKVNDALNSAQRAQLAQRRAFWESRLERVAKADADSLSPDELALRLRIIDMAGAAALKETPQRLRTQRGIRERFMRGLEISGRYDTAFRQSFRDAGLPEDLAYLPHVESSFQPNARSSVGAVGMWQFTRTAGQRFMTVNRVVDERFDPVASSRGAARYLKHAYGQLGDWGLAITSYNHGIQGMMRARSQFGTDFGRIVREYDGKTFGFASRNFYAEFLAVREIASDPRRFFPEGVSFESPLRHTHVVLERPARATDLANRYGIPQKELVAMNPSWQERAKRGGAAIPAGVLVNLPLASGKVVASAGESAIDPASRSDIISRPRQAAANSNRGVVHVVRKGDSPWLIAANYGVTVSELLANNQLSKRAVLRPGQRLDIPTNG